MSRGLDILALYIAHTLLGTFVNKYSILSVKESTSNKQSLKHIFQEDLL